MQKPPMTHVPVPEQYPTEVCGTPKQSVLGRTGPICASTVVNIASTIAVTTIPEQPQLLTLNAPLPIHINEPIDEAKIFCW